MTQTSSLSPCSFCGQTPGPGDEPFKPGVPVTFQNVELDVMGVFLTETMTLNLLPPFTGIGRPLALSHRTFR